jgi:glycosyltransferase involved in cell wall biosynthesis
MKIVVIVRARDEEHRIGKFCESYKDADQIIVSDGGSEDRTVEIASGYPNVILSPFLERTELNHRFWRNNDSDHVNHLIREANKLKPNWIIFDDADCRPNYLLRQDYRSILEKSDKDYIMAVRIYFWGTDQYFPRMSSPGGQLEPSLWAWRGSLDFWTINNPPAYFFRVGDKKTEDMATDATSLFPPYCLLHYSWDSPDRVEHHIKNYRDSGFMPGYDSPLQFAGSLSPLEEWMRE